MKYDDELEILLGEIPNATSSMNFNATHSNAHPHLTNLVDHGHGHAVCDTHELSGYGYGRGLVHGIYDDGFLKHKYASSSSPVSEFSLQYDGSSSSLLLGGRLSFSNIEPPSPPQFEEFRPPLIYGNGFWLDLNRAKESHLFDDMNLSRDFSKMYINGQQGKVSVPTRDVESCDQRLDCSILVNFGHGASDNYRKVFSDCGGFNLSIPRGPMNYEGDVGSGLMEMQHDPRNDNFWTSGCSPHGSHGLFSKSNFSHSAMSPHYQRTNMLANNNYPLGFSLPDSSSSLNLPLVGDSFFHASRNGMNLNESRDSLYLSKVFRSARMMHYYNEEHLLPYRTSLSGRNKVSFGVRVPRAIDETFAREDPVIIQDEGLNYGLVRGHINLRGHNKKEVYNDNVMSKSRERWLNLDGRRPHIPMGQDSCRSPKIHCHLSISSKCSSFTEAQGYMYHIAKDQKGCRFLQRMFDEGTSQDVQIIFNEIIDHVVELMMNPFGNYLMQKLLEVCTEEQRTHIILRVTEEPGELVRISLNTHGTRVVQKLIETLKTRQQISLVIAALEPGFLSLIKDINGNHVVQRCLQHFTSEDSKFIFAAAAKYCVDIATHQHGCCVLQCCISHSTGQHRENLISDISANGLLLAQDAFGNYVVQFILELRIPTATSKLTSQFEGNYVHLSRQKFSSHVVEKCLLVCNDKEWSNIIHELLSAPYFERLLQDPHANYVVQTAVRVSEGPLHNSLVDAIESYKDISRNSPYSKRIFSLKLLKR